MSSPRMGKGVIIGENVQFGKDVVIWNYVVIGDNTKIGKGTRIGSFCDIGKNVMIGRNCIIQAHVTISNECRIGDNVFIGPNSSLLNDKFPHSRCLTPSIIKDNVIIGGCVTILPNVTVHENSVVAAGSVVTKDVPPNNVVKGVPAKPMMTRQEYEAKRKEFIKEKKSEVKT
ncbi:MAG: DapH/DapD/GlmU-related protein [Candidatus Bathyarchaeia archaeon]